MKYLPLFILGLMSALHGGCDVQTTDYTAYPEQFRADPAASSNSQQMLVKNQQALEIDGAPINENAVLSLRTSLGFMIDLPITIYNGYFRSNVELPQGLQTISATLNLNESQVTFTAQNTAFNVNHLLQELTLVFVFNQERSGVMIDGLLCYIGLFANQDVQFCEGGESLMIVDMNDVNCAPHFKVNIFEEAGEELLMTLPIDVEGRINTALLAPLNYRAELATQADRGEVDADVPLAIMEFRVIDCDGDRMNQDEDEPEQDEPEQEEPNQEEPNQDEPEQEEPNQDEPEQEEPEQEEPNQDEPEQDEPEQDEPEQDEPEQEEPNQDEPNQDEPNQDEVEDEEPAPPVPAGVEVELVSQNGNEVLEVHQTLAAGRMEVTFSSYPVFTVRVSTGSLIALHMDDGTGFAPCVNNLCFSLNPAVDQPQYRAEFELADGALDAELVTSNNNEELIFRLTLP